MRSRWERTPKKDSSPVHDARLGSGRHSVYTAAVTVNRPLATMLRPPAPLLALLLAALIVLSGCGQTGPLYLPDDQTETKSNAKKRTE